jgi:hypothetical protein
MLPRAFIPGSAIESPPAEPVAAVILAEVRNGIDVRHPTSAQPYPFNIMLPTLRGTYMLQTTYCV